MFQNSYISIVTDIENYKITKYIYVITLLIYLIS